MLVVTEKIREILKEKNISQNELARKINYKHGTFGTFISGKSAFPDHVVEELAPILEVSADKIKSWILVDKYSKEVLKLAVKAKEEASCNNKSILATKIDEILQNKDMSRTQLSKLAKYDQSAVNKMIMGKISFSNVVLARIASVLEVPEDEIKSWIVADKYSLQVLELALNV